MRNFGCGRRLRRRHYSRLACSPLLLCLLHPLRNLLRRHPHDPQRRPLLPLPLHGKRNQAGRALHCRRHQARPPRRPGRKHPGSRCRTGGGVSHLPGARPGIFLLANPAHPSPMLDPFREPKGSSPTRSPLNPTHNAPKISNRVLAQSRQKRNIQPLARVLLHPPSAPIVGGPHHNPIADFPIQQTPNHFRTA